MQQQQQQQQASSGYTFADIERALIQGGAHATAQHIGHRRRFTARGAGENRYKQFNLLVYDIVWMGPVRHSPSGQQFTLTCYAVHDAGAGAGSAISREMALWSVTYDSLLSLFKAQPFDPRAFTLE